MDNPLLNDLGPVSVTVKKEDQLTIEEFVELMESVELIKNSSIEEIMVVKVDRSTYDDYKQRVEQLSYTIEMSA